jgi:predicted ArsR family transcriptional regulator
MPCLITLSQKELHRLEAIQKIRDHRLSVVQAAEVLNLSRSQVHRLLRAYEHDDAVGIASRKRGRPSNRRYDEAFRNAALDLIRERYLDFGPTLAREKLTVRELAELLSEPPRDLPDLPSANYQNTHHRTE